MGRKEVRGGRTYLTISEVTIYHGRTGQSSSAMPARNKKGYVKEPGEATVPRSTSDLLLPLNSPSFRHLPICSSVFILYPRALTDIPRRTWQVPAFLSPIKLLTYNVNCHHLYSRHHSTSSVLSSLGHHISPSRCSRDFQLLRGEASRGKIPSLLSVLNTQYEAISVSQ